jgi:hypothetical protein
MTLRGTSKKTLAIYAVGGAVLGYGVLHPVTMVIYMFELSPPASRNVGALINAALERALHSFDPSMGLMGGYFLILGTALGLVAGAYARALCRQSALIARQEKALGRDLASLLQSGEDERTEFKSSLRWDRRLGTVNKELEHAVTKTVASFMNGEGGTLIIGADDHGTPVGLVEDMATLKRKDEDGFEQYLMQLVSTRLGSHFCPLVHVIFHALGDLRLCRVYVEGASAPVYLRNGRDKEFFIRTGNSTRVLDVEEAMQYIKRRWGAS